jgi:hypothetical protein
MLPTVTAGHRIARHDVARHEVGAFAESSSIPHPEDEIVEMTWRKPLGVFSGSVQTGLNSGPEGTYDAHNGGDTADTSEQIPQAQKDTHPCKNRRNRTLRIAVQVGQSTSLDCDNSGRSIQFVWIKSIIVGREVNARNWTFAAHSTQKP